MPQHFSAKRSCLGQHVPWLCKLLINAVHLVRAVREYHTYAAKTPVQILGIEGCDPHLPCKMSGVTQKETSFESFAVLVYLSAFIWTRTCLPHWQSQLCWNGDLVAGGDVLQLSS